MARMKSKMLEDIPVTKIKWRQLNLVNIVGTEQNPHLEVIPVSNNADYNFPYVNVLIDKSGYYVQAIPGYDFSVEYHISNAITVKLPFSGNCKIMY